MTERIYAQSDKAKASHALVKDLQKCFKEQLISNLNDTIRFEEKTWLRSQGSFGGGERFESKSPFFNNASINTSQVHYESVPEKKLNSATALSSIIHPNNPHCPSIHVHFSYTEMKSGQGYWRMMADLNPSIECSLKDEFEDTIRLVIPDKLNFGFQLGDQYFYIPHLKRHRGISHYYLEQYKTDSFEDDLTTAKTLAEAVLKYYCDSIATLHEKQPTATDSEKSQQLDYHTLYFFQVLTLDKGTTAGLLIHNENDLGILGSLPKYLNKKLLSKWQQNMSEPQNYLVKEFLKVLPNQDTVEITPEHKLNFCNIIRKHYQTYPDAIKFQASCDHSPDSIANHNLVR